MHQEDDRRHEIKPMVGTDALGISLGSMGTARAKTITYASILCLMCRNLMDLASSGTRPLEVTMSDYDKTIVIPSILASRLLNLHEESEIIIMIRKYVTRLERIYQKWERNGQNTCRGCRIGKKMRMKIEHTMLDCWIIIDCSSVCYIRLSYGGGRIQCP